MKTTSNKSRRNTINKYYLLMVLASTIGFAQTEKKSEESPFKAKSDLSSANIKSNPYYKDNQTAGEMSKISNDGKVEGIDDWQTQSTKTATDVSLEPVQVTKTRTKNNQTNERTTKPNGQDNGNPFPQKKSVSNVLKTKHDTAKNSVGNIR
jgi:hypothetical protein